MRKLFWLLAALLLAFYAQTIWQTATVDTLFIVRDGLLVALIGAFCFALGSSRLGDGTQPLLGHRLTIPGAMLLYTGAACTLVGGLLTTVIPLALGQRSGLILWWLGLLLLLLSIGLRRAWQAQTTTPAGNSPVGVRSPGFPLLPLLFVTLIGIGIRLLVLSQLPAFCLGAECEGALSLTPETPWLALSTPALWLARASLLLTTDTLFSLRLGVAVLGMLTVAIFYLAAQQLAGRAAALLGALLLALSPWHSATDGSSGPWITALLVVTLALWLWLEGYRRQQGRWALAAGLLLGLLVYTNLLGAASLLGWALLLWLLLLGLLAVGAGEQRQLLGLTLLLLGGFLVIALPTLVTQWRTATLVNGLDSAGLPWSTLLLILFQQGLGAANGWAAVPLLTMGLGAFVLVGLGLLLRNLLRHWLAGWLLGGLVIFVVVLHYTAEPMALALLLLPALLTATLALQQLFATFQQPWQPLLHPTRTLAGATLLLLLFTAPAVGQLLEQSTQVRSTAEANLEVAMARYITTQRANLPDAAIFAPASLTTSPSIRLVLDGATVDAIQPLGDAFNALYSAAVIGDNLYLVPTAEGALLDLLQRLFPAALPEIQFDPESGQPLFTGLLVTAAMQRAQLGLPGLLWEGDAPATAAPTLALPQLPSLQPIWPVDLPLDRPFTARWQGTLRVPVAGAYNLTIEGGDPAHFVTLQIDQQLVLDSSFNLTSQTLTFAKGFYPIELTVRRPDPLTATLPAQVAIRWQRPDGVAEVIGGEYLSLLTPPDWGLVGEYYSGSEWQGTPLDQRKDPLIGLVTALPSPYSVRWQGKVAAERTGEYLFAVLAAPTSITRLLVDGTQLVDTSLVPVPEGETASGYAEGVLYLTQGWHDLTVDFAPDPAAPGLQLFWQPPGNGPTTLLPQYLAPTPGVLTVDRPLPALPATVNGEIGSGFALSQGVEYWKPQVRMPPTALGTLGMETQWRVGSCGNALDQLSQPHGVAISAARQLIYVADTGNRRVVEYGFDGQPKQSYQSADWQEPFDIGLIDQSFPVLLDATTQLLYDLNPATGAITTRPQTVSFYRPRGLGIDEVGNLAVADTGGARVAFLAGGGESLGAVGGPETAIGRGQPVDVVTAGGQRWAITAEDGRLWQLDRGGSVTAVQPTDTLNGPQLAATPNGALFVSDPARRVVLYLAATGQPLAFFAPPDLLLPTGVATAMIDDLLYFTLVDSASCELGLWRTPITMLPTP